MKRVPFSYSTFIDTQKKAFNKASREKTTVSTVIHNFLLEYTAGEPDLTQQTAKPVALTNTADSERTSGEIPEAIHSEQNPVGDEILQPPLLSGKETVQTDPALTEQPENKTTTEPVEAAHTEDNNAAVYHPQDEGKPVPPSKKNAPVIKPPKKPSNVTVKKTPPQKALKKVTPKPVVPAKKKNLAGKSNKSKAKS
jgi:hypothetical protein